MSLMDSILSWSLAELSDWQRDALRRLVQKQDLDSQDVADLYAMLKTAHGISDSQKRMPVPLAKEHLPVQDAGSSRVILRALRDLKYVNRIAQGQKLEFSPNGITVIYGRNASGKSGYSRVLKRACRARDLSETVHTDASDVKSEAYTPEAIFDIEVEGKTTALVWKRGETPPEELSTISVFDGRCARAYLDAEQEAAYLPYGLDILESLGQRILPELSKRLNLEIEAISTDPSPFSDLQGDTEVGKTISSLGAGSDFAKITALATLTEAEKGRLGMLSKTLSESDPHEKAIGLRLSAGRFSALLSRIETAIKQVDDACVEKLRAVDHELGEALKAEIASAKQFRSGETLLPGTGEQLWKDMLAAACRFSTEVAYPGSPFPKLGDAALCPLCQQELDNEGSKRMRRFADFVQKNAAKAAVEKRKQHEKEVQKLRLATLGFALDLPLEKEIKQLDAPLLEAIKTFEIRIEGRRKWLVSSMESHSWSEPTLLDSDPSEQLKAHSRRLNDQAEDLDLASDEKKRQALAAAHRELSARASLTPRLGALLDLVNRTKQKNSLIQCKSDLKTKTISDKAREFASQVVTKELEKALNEEFKALGVGYIKTRLAERVGQAKMMHKLVLDLPTKKKLDEILSEGEQRAIAIGSFLAELHLAGHKGGIIFDDPVSSLDHNWRKNVARRLVREAKYRQVIILTHDTVFLGEIRDALEYQEVKCLIHHLDWICDRPGFVLPGLPWEHQNYAERLDGLEKEQKKLEISWPAQPNESDRDRMRKIYNRLRAVIERVVEDVLLNGVVERYRDWIRISNLSGVVGLAAPDCAEVMRLYKECCAVVDAHDPASAKDAPVPTPTDLSRDIQDLKTVIARIKANRKKADSKEPAAH